MKSYKTIYSFFILIFCTVIFSSCLSIDRKIILNKDGSGNEIMKITFDKTFYQMMASMTSMMDSSRVQGYMDSLYSDQIFLNETKAKYDSAAGINLTDIYSEKNSDESNSFIVKYEFDSVQKINNSALSKFKENNNESSTEVTYTKDGDKILFGYLMSNSSNNNQTENLQNSNDVANDSVSNQNEITDKLTKGMADMFKDDEVSIEIIFPYEVISSNATSTDGNKLIWKYSLSESISTGNIKLEAVMRDY
ncbi:MAG: hypothetical protein LH629_09125 [Ignavibacteria bacterium]|nr:hypothetical protein [Ignavibacteria bacterium]